MAKLGGWATRLREGRPSEELESSVDKDEKEKSKREKESVPRGLTSSFEAGALSPAKPKGQQILNIVQVTVGELLAEHQHYRAACFCQVVCLGVRNELGAHAKRITYHHALVNHRRARGEASNVRWGEGVGVEAIRERKAKDWQERIGVLGGLWKSAKDKEGAKRKRESKEAEKKKNKEKDMADDLNRAAALHTTPFSPK
ncbi:hypothetical protein BD410DRAFT_840946 [Rickenella mellea]|uniref:Uncharacterized protein n=1 Tax=Rickenella mellea TaxID=50990 RepID=A0A4Y7Q005_9AGAM|nr:hypothetical protein BD410DRAFT_840946 [Rickenella mellea]